MPPTQKGGMSVAVQRLQQDYLRLVRDPVPFVTAHPLHSNMFEWHYLVRGPSDSPYSGGYYHGKLIFPKEYPFRPPSIYMITPNGRFACNTRLCLSISDFHPDSWNPAWSVSTILTGLLSFMLEDTPTMGSITTSTYDKHVMAKESAEFNLKNELFVELFPDVVKEVKAKRLASRTGNSSSGNRSGIPGVADMEEFINVQRGTGGAAGGQLPFIVVFILFGIFAISVKIVMEFLGEPVG
ncbi:unnamed protein product [Mesocestoides corti]|uniref:Ubiquitin-conjugating enzyme E2 J2 n=1 Tax=Mesocestoides corti TaxID=53468 RepID=A0A0R3UMX5_MESCO|nr:unnamed protein product [Mesocestoides corti]